MLNIYIDTSFLTEQHRGIIFPQLLGLHYKHIPLVKDFYKITVDINKADILILPLHVEYFLKHNRAVYFKFLKLFKTYKIPVWVYGAGDQETTLKDDVYTLRCGGFNITYDQSKTFIMSCFVSDPYQNSLNNKFTLIEKNKVLEIGFVGHADGSALKWLKEAAIFLKYNVKRFLNIIVSGHQHFYPSSVIRSRRLKELENTDKVHTNFIYRSKYRAGANSVVLREKTTKEYFENIFFNPYALCIRGVGNFLVRLHETLATGRIPVLIDTECNLPLPESIKWENHKMRIKEANVNKLPEALEAYHNKLSDQDFVAKQEENRNLWVAYFNLDGYLEKYLMCLKYNK
ncbi:hypothetical protein [Winogradskyella damuponensis]|uniref:Exostosin GT47 domain-containing protein n=1 Tax=Winogradskyella damuponensis TaxID=943939 RepID=A0ABP8CXL0_9FLAO